MSSADGVWTTVVEPEAVAAARARAEARAADGEHLPLLGTTLAVKDNIDVDGLPTTLGAPSLGYVPARSADAVERMVDAGAVVVGKTNLDQLATGLVGTRAPYFGACRNPIDPDRIAGGSSSGSAVAVATGAATLALGTDTAGSGRVPAACCGVIGVKPTPGLVSTRGVFPASPSFDCVSIFSMSCADAASALAVLGPTGGLPVARPITRLGVPMGIDWHGDDDARSCFDGALERLGALTDVRIDIDPSVLTEAGALLYESALVAERLASFGELVERDPAAIDPAILTILERARAFSAADVFAALERLRVLRAAAGTLWADVDALVVPTIVRHPTIREASASSIEWSRELGTHTTFVNPLGWAALAVPAGHRANGLPFGISLVGPAHSDAALLDLGAAFLGEAPPDLRIDGIELVVVGAHLRGQPLHHQLVDRDARFVAATRTAPVYALHALPTEPPKPGLVHVGTAGRAIDVEVWTLAKDRFGDFVAAVPRPLAIGTVELADGRSVPGFVCEPAALDGAFDITTFGGWRAWPASLP